jgi:hypothetical protein
MDQDSIEVYGNVGTYAFDGNLLSFQLGEQLMNEGSTLVLPAYHNGMPVVHEHQWLGIQGYNVVMRGMNNMLIEEVTQEIKHNRLLPRLYSKEIKMLYGHGHVCYRWVLQDGKMRREYVQLPVVSDWLDSWPDYGLPSAEEFSKANIKNFYYFGDFFCKWRFSRGKQLGIGLPVSGLENIETKHCLLATKRQDVVSELISYQDFTHVAVGKWVMRGSQWKIYPKLSLRDIQDYKFAAVSHHREKSVDEYYGVNETHQGARPYIQGSNKTAHYINSFLKNSLAAKVHIIVPNAWLQSKRTQIQTLCKENQKRKAQNMELIKYNGLEIGTEYSETVLIKYLREELRKVGQYLSGEQNQGKAYSTVSFMDSSGNEQRWRIEPVDLKYKEYIDALISYDKRTEEALLSSVGLDASISAVSKDGLISKSGSDAYYNYLIYIMSLTPEEDICTEPLNMAMRVNFPDLYRQGYRIGFYREVPQRQEDVAPNDRLNRQQS